MYSIYLLIYFFLDSIETIEQPTVNDGNILKVKQLIDIPLVIFKLDKRYDTLDMDDNKSTNHSKLNISKSDLKNNKNNHPDNRSNNDNIRKDSMNNIIKYHTLMMIDVDYPSRSHIHRRYYLQWLIVDIPEYDILAGQEVFN